MTGCRLNGLTLALVIPHLLATLAPPRPYTLGPVPQLVREELRTTYLPEDRLEIKVRTYSFDDGSAVTIERAYPVLPPWPVPDEHDWRALDAWTAWDADQRAYHDREKQDAREEAIEVARMRPGERTGIGVGVGRGPMAGRHGK